MCWVVRNLQLPQLCLLLITTLMCHRFSPDLIGCMKTVIKKKNKGFVGYTCWLLGRKQCKGGRWHEIYSDYVRMPSIKPCVPLAPVIKHCIRPRWQPHETHTNFLSPSGTSFLSWIPQSSPFSSFSPITCLSLLSRPLAQLSIPSCFYCHPSLFESNHAPFFFSHQHRSSVTLVPLCVLPHSFPSSPFIWDTTVRQQQQQSQCSLK